MTAVTLKPDEQSVIAAVSCAFSAPWRPGENPPDAYICLDGDDVPVEISTLTQLVTDKEAKDGTRAVMGDYIATGALGDDLDRELAPMIPEGYRIALVTEAPINQRRKTKRRLTKYLRELLHRPSDFPAPHCVEVNGNHFQIYLDHHGEPLPRAVYVGFMHRRGAFDYGDDARLALKIRIESKTWTCRHLLASGRPVWLALLNDLWLTDGHIFRCAWSTLGLEHPFSKILLVSRSGLVETLC